MADEQQLTATEAGRRLRNGRVTAAALMAAYLDRIAERETMVHAFAFLDTAAAMQAAEQADRRGPTGVLHGLPIGVKDVLDTADMPTAYGSPIWSGHRPRADAAAVALARAAGALILGKTMTTEFAGSHPGPTTNPANPAHTPGGSSSGSAAAVADGFCPLAFGTQTAGSVIRPAAFCGVVGYKPSFGMIHRAGMKVMSESLDTIGALARTVADCALLISAVAGVDLGNPDIKPDRTPRLALCLGPLADRAAPETLVLLEQASAAARAAGARVEPLQLSSEVAAAASAHAIVMYGETARALAWELAQMRPLVSAALSDKVDWALAQPAGLLAAARATFASARAALVRDLHGFDAILTPSASGEAPKGLASTGDPAFNLLWTALHAPCVTVPAGTGPRGLPLGVQIVARPGEDREALAWAEWVRSAVV
jgi:Asp-tRNA(Asn)/Glu-tRNA(Gln) amidotransferase A subunit family amidase